MSPLAGASNQSPPAHAWRKRGRSKKLKLSWWKMKVKYPESEMFGLENDILCPGGGRA